MKVKVKFLKNGKLFIVQTTHTHQIVFSHKSKNACYEWIFKQINYA